MALVETAHEGRVATVTLNRPEAMNAANGALLRELLAAFSSLASNEEVGAIVLTGVGKSFAAGADIAEMHEYTPNQARAYSELGQAVTGLIEHVPQPTIAAVNGFALGGGCELALACDIRLAAANARFGQPEINLGIMPGWGGHAAACPHLRAWVRAGTRLHRPDVRCGRGAQMGFGQLPSVPKKRLMAKAMEMAATIAGKSRVALQNIKLATLRALDQDLTGGLRMEADLFGMCFSTEDQTEGMDAFLGKRPPAFRHR